MKNFYKIIASITLASAFTLTSLVSCQSDNFKDSDFDGLVDNIDPDPSNNQYQISLSTGTEETGQLTLTMDYRDFLTPGYKYNLGILGSFLVNEIDTNYQPKVHNNVYPKVPTIDSVTSPLLAQIGAKDMEMINISSNKFEVDPYDVADALMAHHVFMNNGKKYQIYFVVIRPYPLSTGWVSNFDVGATNDDGTFTDLYKEIEGDTHPDWIEGSNRFDHKGFSVTSTRLLKGIKIYQEMHHEVNATPIVFVTGHSRGGAITNLIGKDFIDNNKEIRAYCFNPANTTIVDDTEAKKESYSGSIFNIINNGDLVSRIPSFGFKLYGKDFINNIDNNKHKEFLKKDYEGNTPEAVTDVAKLLDHVVTKGEGEPSRKNFYDFRDPDDDYPEKWEGTKDEMDKLKKELDDGYFMPNDSYARKCFEYDDVKGTDPDCYIEYRTRPVILKALLIDLLDKEDFTYLLSYLKLLDRLITEALKLYIISGFTVIGVVNGHIQPIACVMASQIQE